MNHSSQLSGFHHRLQIIIKAVIPILGLIFPAFFLLTTHAHATERQTISLDGTWYFLPRLGDRGEGGRMRYESAGAIRSTWRRIDVPSCWQRAFRDLEFFEGISWYSRDFEFDGDSDSVYAELAFEGVNYICRVYLNGKVLGDHEGGYTRFTLPAGHALKRGTNTVSLRVDNRRHLLKVPANIGWFNYGGIYRPVSLNVYPELHLEGLRVRTKVIEPDGLLGVEVDVAGITGQDARPAVILVELIDKDGNKAASARHEIFLAGRKEKAVFDVRVKKRNLHLWSPENPYLYTLKASLLMDGRSQDVSRLKTGIRTFKVEGRDFLLNGKALNLRGLCYLYDFEKSGRTLDENTFAEDIANFRELGINAIRNHFPFETRMLEAFDSLGLVIWHDVPVYWMTGYDSYTLKQARQTAAEMVASYGNHPCVALWSLGNENEISETDRQAFFLGLRDELKSRMPEAVTTCALNQGWDVMAKIIDVFSTNIYPGWFDFLGRDPIVWHPDSAMLAERIAEQAEAFRGWLASNPAMPFWVSELGAGAAYGLYGNDPWRLFSEGYHAHKLGKELQMIASFPEISGIFPFCYNDYYDPSRMHAPGQNGQNLMGIVTIGRKKKEAFDVLSRFYRQWGQ
jgi:beta-glucuronidase